MPTFSYPSAAEIRQIEQDKLPNLTANDPIFSILPIEESDEAILLWEQMDNYTGLQQIRGLNGAPPRVKKVGGKRFMMEPGYYGEHIALDEQQLTLRRQYGSFGTPINISDLVMSAQDQLLDRRIARMKFIGWTLVTTGTFVVPNPLGGNPLHSDAFTLKTFDAAVSWADYVNSTPLADLRAMQLNSRGQSADFGPAATLYVNRVTVNHLMSNRNGADLYGKRQAGLATPLSLAEINQILTGEGLPNIAVWDDGYLNDAGTFVPWIGDLAGVCVGRRTSGASIGNMRLTRNANNPNMEPGAYTAVIDSLSDGNARPPRNIEVHDGFNGGPVLYFPGALIQCTLS